MPSREKSANAEQQQVGSRRVQCGTERTASWACFRASAWAWRTGEILSSWEGNKYEENQSLNVEALQGVLGRSSTCIRAASVSPPSLPHTHTRGRRRKSFTTTHLKDTPLLELLLLLGLVRAKEALGELLRGRQGRASLGRQGPGGGGTRRCVDVDGGNVGHSDWVGDVKVG